tara:strand:+ start:797 stop:1438 length:642 start_codon:yes stop_codon:yes gene_type:complete
MRIILLLLILSTSIYGQTKLDSIFSIEFPTEPEKYEFTEKNEKAISFYSNDENESFVAMSMIKLDGETEFKNNLPNLKSLKKAYEKMIEVQIDAMRKKTFIFKDTAQIIINDFIGYKITYQDEHSGNQNAESILLLINGINFVATYSKVNEFNENNKNIFFNSIKIDTSKKPKQLAEPYDLKENLLELFFKLIFAIGLFYLWRKYKKTTGNNS